MLLTFLIPGPKIVLNLTLLAKNRHIGKLPSAAAEGNVPSVPPAIHLCRRKNARPRDVFPQTLLGSKKGVYPPGGCEKFNAEGTVRISSRGGVAATFRCCCFFGL